MTGRQREIGDDVGEIDVADAARGERGVNWLVGVELFVEGDGIGAVIIHTPGRLHGHEIEVSPVADPAHRTHAAVRARYVADLGPLGLLPFFEPTDRRVTLSSDSLDAAFEKPNQMIFRAALDKIAPGLACADAMLITEELPHVLAVRSHGMVAIHFKGPGQSRGEADKLIDLAPLIRKWVSTPRP